MGGYIRDWIRGEKCRLLARIERYRGEKKRSRQRRGSVPGKKKVVISMVSEDTGVGGQLMEMIVEKREEASGKKLIFFLGKGL